MKTATEILRKNQDTIENYIRKNGENVGVVGVDSTSLVLLQLIARLEEKIEAMSIREDAFMSLVSRTQKSYERAIENVDELQDQINQLGREARLDYEEITNRIQVLEASKVCS